MRKEFIYILLLAASAFGDVAEQSGPKREFRGAWLPTVTGNYMGMSENEMKSVLLQELNALENIGINAILFQIRPEADAWYKSDFEPWSRFITGSQGKNPGWDPTAFMVEECHKRGIEFHAWINPYRVKTNNGNSLSSNHIYYNHPEWFMEYGGQTFFNPALQESRDFICFVIRDILSKYDVDAIHMDDYFYPYPKDNEEIDDDFYFKVYGKGYRNKDDWRRNNVNMLIEQIHKTIKEEKPYVQLGISPFGIYRNKSSWPKGSDTNGLQNYDDLYADVLLWADKGWVDYLIPQIYWEIGHRAADYDRLVDWWADNVNEDCALYIGQDVVRTVNARDLNYPKNQLDAKILKQRARHEIDGFCFWPGRELIDNKGNYTTDLVNRYFKNPALSPVIDRFASHKPGAVRKMKAVWTIDGYVLFWTAPKVKSELEKPVKYCVYRFGSKEKVNLEDSSKLIEITTDPYISLPYDNGKKRYKYVVTSVDRFNNESKAKTKKVKL